MFTTLAEILRARRVPTATASPAFPGERPRTDGQRDRAARPCSVQKNAAACRSSLRHFVSGPAASAAVRCPAVMPSACASRHAAVGGEKAVLRLRPTTRSLAIVCFRHRFPPSSSCSCGKQCDRDRGVKEHGRRPGIHPSVSGHRGGHEMREIVNAILYQGRPAASGISCPTTCCAGRYGRGGDDQPTRAWWCRTRGACTRRPGYLQTRRAGRGRTAKISTCLERVTH